jgi:hypothetical protein
MRSILSEGGNRSTPEASPAWRGSSVESWLARAGSVEWR